MKTQEIVAKLWNLCNVLRDDGITYHQYVTELTYLLFLKMAKETDTEKYLPEGFRWDDLRVLEGIELKKFYQDMLRELGEGSTSRVREIYTGAQTNIDEPKNLKKIIDAINDLDWYSAREEGLGNLYEGLLEKNANEKKSGAGQYFTPRVLIDVMVRLIDPQPGERCNDPACGTFGFMIAASEYVRRNTDNHYSLDGDRAEFQVKEAFTGVELVHDTPSGSDECDAAQYRGSYLLGRYPFTTWQGVSMVMMWYSLTRLLVLSAVVSVLPAMT